MFGSITGIGFSQGGSAPATTNANQSNASGQGRGKHHGAVLTVSAGSLSFGNVTVNTAKPLPLTLTSSGTSAVTVNSATVTGAGFSIAQSFPVTLNPGQSLTLVVQFDPTVAGTVSGQLTISSNSSTGSTTVVSLAGAGTAANPLLTISATSLTFPSVVIGTATTLPLTLTSSGTSAVTVNSATTTGAGFSIVGGGSFPVTLNPTQTLTLQVQFDPTVTGNASGQLTINSNSISTSTSSVVVKLSGAGTAHQVDLSWDAPASSPDPVAGYNVYRSTSNGSFAFLNTSVVTALSYVDSTVVSGSYSYDVKSVDSSGVESTASNQVTVTVP